MDAKKVVEQYLHKTGAAHPLRAQIANDLSQINEKLYASDLSQKTVREAARYIAQAISALKRD